MKYHPFPGEKGGISFFYYVVIGFSQLRDKLLFTVFETSIVGRSYDSALQNARKSWGIATPACALVRNDSIYFSALNNNFPVC